MSKNIEPLMSVASTILKAGELVYKNEFKKNSLEHFNTLHEMWMKSCQDNHFLHNEIFDLNEEKLIAQIKIPQLLQNLDRDYIEGNEYYQYQDLLKQADSAITPYTALLTKNNKNYNAYVYPDIPAKLYAMQLISYLVSKVAPRGKAKCEETTSLLKMMIAFLNRFQAVPDSNQRLVPCQTAISYLTSALAELKKIAENTSAREDLEFLKTNSLELAKNSLSLFIKLVFPHDKVINHQNIDLRAFKEGIAVRRPLTNDSALFFPKKSDFFPLENIKKTASYILTAQECGADLTIKEALPTIDELMPPEEEKIYQNYLNYLYSNPKRVVNWFFNNYHPFYFGFKIIVQERESGLSAQYRVMTAAELKSVYSFVTHLLSISISAAALSLIASSSTKFILNYGQVAFLCEHYRDNVFDIMQKTLAKIQLNYNITIQHLSTIEKDVALLHKPDANNLINIINKLHGNMAKSLAKIREKVNGLSTLNPVFVKAKATQDELLINEILNAVISTQGLECKPLMPTLTHPLEQEHKILEIKQHEQKISQLKQGMQQTIEKTQSLTPLFVSIGGIITTMFMIVNQIDNRESPNAALLLKSLALAMLFLLIALSYLMKKTVQNFTTPTLSGSRDNLYNGGTRSAISKEQRVQSDEVLSIMVAPAAITPTG